MANVVYTSFGSKQYRVCWDAARGAFRVVRQRDRWGTRWFGEGEEEVYRDLKRAWRDSRKVLNRACHTLTFYPEEMG